MNIEGQTKPPNYMLIYAICEQNVSKRTRHEPIGYTNITKNP